MKSGIAAIFLIFAVFIPAVFAAKKSEKDKDDPLDAVNREIAALEARISAIEHIKKYAESINLSELSGRDVEQTVAHFVKSTT